MVKNARLDRSLRARRMAGPYPLSTSPAGGAGSAVPPRDGNGGAVTDGLDRDLFRRVQKKIALVGIGHLPFAKDIGRPIADTAVEAIQLALDDAGLVAEDVDGMVMF